MVSTLWIRKLEILSLSKCLYQVSHVLENNSNIYSLGGMLLLCSHFEEVEGAYCFRVVHPSICHAF